MLIVFGFIEGMISILYAVWQLSTFNRQSFLFNFLVDFRERSAKLIEIKSVSDDEVSTLETPEFNIDS